jgi:mannose/fructose/N-acetylgalactosamine-specific phosphotransferase system component IIC
MLVLKPLKYAYRELIANRIRQIPFWILVGFLPTFLAARLVVDEAPGLYLRVHHVHVHHFTYGIIVLAAVGFISLVTTVPSRVMAVFYGLGLALSFDEFGMWVRLTDHYNIDQSVDVMVGILVFLVFLVYGIGILRRAFPYMKKTVRRQG